MTVGYVVSQVGYDYNDEIYYQNESGGGTPMKVYLDYNKAKAEVDKLNFEEILNCEIDQYAYDLEDIIDDMDQFWQIINKYDSTVKYKHTYETGSWLTSHISTFSKEDQAKLADIITLKFYEITKVEIEGDMSAKVTQNTDSNRFNV